MSKRRLSPTLVQDQGRICCASCGHDLAPAGQGWKAKAALSVVAVDKLPGAGSGIDTAVVIRRFACPTCATLLDSETALPEDPFLEDVVAA